MKTAATDIESVVREQARFVFKVAYSMLRNVEDAEDAVQETFLRVHRSGELPNVREMKSWLARIAFRVALDCIQRRPKGELGELIEAGFQARSGEAGAERHLLQQEQAAILHRLIVTLPEDLRHTLVLSTVEEMSSVEIGKVLGVPEATVRTRLFRARQMLKEKLLVRMGVGDGTRRS
ncbi:MAG TPA: sigma-70 family RNA polymerase sigma factor [Candidatus Polarisedimenticolia bacterium]|nr:sigma-70 family RNA polymerase sigma factor [Candidatus Polarisedimenticolia bacterium]